jgi:DNA invertase Pin-like site-specific DNA recombinase
MNNDTTRATTTHPRYVAYYRVSTKKQGDSGLGLEAQRNIVRYYYPNIECEFTEVKSAKNISERPILQEAIRYCKQTGAILVFAKVDRLSRSTVDGLTVLKELNGNVRFCDFPGEPDEFVITMILALAQRERELISIRTKAAKQVLKRRGVKQGRVANLTGQMQGAEANRQIALSDKNNQRAMSMIRVMTSQKLTLERMAIRLNEENFTTSRGGKWNKVTVGRMVRRIGKMETV